MPMREELYIPLGHPLHRDSGAAARRNMDTELVCVIAFAAIGLTISIGLMLDCPLPADLGMALAALS
jgi:hypothetical protein